MDVKVDLIKQHISNAKQSGYKGNKFNQKGIFGHILAYYGTHEAQHRGTLHFHVILYGGISPEILDAVGGIDDLCHTQKH